MCKRTRILKFPWLVPLEDTEPMPAWRRTDKPYPLDELEDKNAVVRVASWRQGHRFHNNGIITDIPPIRTALEAKDTFPFEDPKTGMGLPERLPLELVWEIMGFLDIGSLLHLMRTNRRAWNMVTAFPECRFATAYGSKALIIIILSKFAPHFTLSELNEALRTERCRCGRFAGYLFFLRLEKCCMECDDSNFEVQTLSTNGVNTGDWSKLKFPKLRMLSIPGNNYWAVYDYGARRWLWLPGTHNIPPEHLMSADYEGEDYEATKMAVTAMPYIHCRPGAPPRVDEGIAFLGCLLFNSYRREQNMVDGKKRQDLWHLRWMLYSVDAFLEHFQWCPEAPRLWEISAGGSKTVKICSYDMENILRENKDAFKSRNVVYVGSEEDQTPEWTAYTELMEKV